MTTSGTSRVRRILDARYRTLRDEVRDAVENSHDLQYVELIDRAPADLGDQSQGDAMADLNLTIVDRHVREMRDIDAARARITHRQYGRCADCDEEIEVQRLLAQPTATRCVTCQRQHERTYAHELMPTL